MIHTIHVSVDYGQSSVYVHVDDPSDAPYMESLLMEGVNLMANDSIARGDKKADVWRRIVGQLIKGIGEKSLPPKS